MHDDRPSAGQQQQAALAEEAEVDDMSRHGRIEKPEQERDLRIVNRRGLHARASAKLVKLVEQFDAQVEVSRDGQTVGGTSIMGLMMLAASPGCCIHVAVAGREAEAVLEAVTKLVEEGFGETD
ncbi:phosphocarrier protein [Breoghania corrubedonensis]|uniref:Phosphocarrier protein n=2 Tax=Breoghania corrubedonensis TaxID=665038 RepID=A0A2T5VG70_9HYPH|nr:phosphocarrier protein [Breoghania corrubedonensis]